MCGLMLFGYPTFLHFPQTTEQANIAMYVRGKKKALIQIFFWLRTSSSGFFDPMSKTSLFHFIDCEYFCTTHYVVCQEKLYTSSSLPPFMHMDQGTFLLKCSIASTLRTNDWVTHLALALTLVRITKKQVLTR